MSRSLCTGVAGTSKCLWCDYNKPGEMQYLSIEDFIAKKLADVTPTEFEEDIKMYSLQGKPHGAMFTLPGVCRPVMVYAIAEMPLTDQWARVKFTFTEEPIDFALDTEIYVNNKPYPVKDLQVGQILGCSTAIPDTAFDKIIRQAVTGMYGPTQLLHPYLLITAEKGFDVQGIRVVGTDSLIPFCEYNLQGPVELSAEFSTEAAIQMCEGIAKEYGVPKMSDFDKRCAQLETTIYQAAQFLIAKFRAGRKIRNSLPEVITMQMIGDIVQISEQNLCTKSGEPEGASYCIALTDNLPKDCPTFVAAQQRMVRYLLSLGVRNPKHIQDVVHCDDQTDIIKMAIEMAKSGEL